MEYELYHHGILGMHWGIRRYQNKDGTWTSAGKKRYSDSEQKAHNIPKKDATKSDKKSKSQASTLSKKTETKKTTPKKESYKNLTPEQQKKKINELGTKLFANSSFKETLYYNKSTYDLAARYIVKDGLSKESALTLAKSQARVNTGALFVANSLRYGF